MSALSSHVRSLVRMALRYRTRRKQKRKLAAVRRAAEYSFPTADIDQMLAEIGRGYLNN
jgi:hypothetical protein